MDTNKYIDNLQIEELPADPKREYNVLVYEDSLYIKVRRTGKKLWVYKYKFNGERKAHYQPFAKRTLSQAIEQYKTDEALLKNGVDPYPSLAKSKNKHVTSSFQINISDKEKLTIKVGKNAVVLNKFQVDALYSFLTAMKNKEPIEDKKQV